MDTLSSAADKQRALLTVKQGEAEEALGFIQASMMQVGGRAVGQGLWGGRVRAGR